MNYICTLLPTTLKPWITCSVKNPVKWKRLGPRISSFLQIAPTTTRFMYVLQNYLCRFRHLLYTLHGHFCDNGRPECDQQMTMTTSLPASHSCMTHCYHQRQDSCWGEERERCTFGLVSFHVTLFTQLLCLLPTKIKQPPPLLPLLPTQMKPTIATSSTAANCVVATIATSSTAANSDEANHRHFQHCCQLR
ncbi:hypothetical protein Btru_052952 [Bulinus truncatus]|nr:hypothetical protein Btru_052952 [Bulinus truncatus]